MEEAVEAFVGLPESTDARKGNLDEAFGLEEEDGVFELDLEGDGEEDSSEEEEDVEEEDDGVADAVPWKRKAKESAGDEGEGEEEDSDAMSESDEEDSELDDAMGRHGRPVVSSSDELDSEADDGVDNAGRLGWGRRKRDYYNGDTADLEIGQDFREAEEEEEAAREQRAAELKTLSAAEASFFGDLLNGPAASAAGHDGDSGAAGSEVEVTKLERRIASLTKPEKLQILMSRAPELLPLLAEARERLTELRDVALPLGERVRAGCDGANALGAEWVRLKRGALLSYLVNLLFYLVLRCGELGDAQGADAGAVREHPVVRALLRHRKALEACSEVDGVLRAQVKKVLRAEPLDPVTNDGRPAQRERKVRVRPARPPAGAGKPVEEVDFVSLILQEKQRQKDAKAAKYLVKKRRRDDTVVEGEKRGATYQIMKNRGLTPHKSKMNRNPRVKKREQYRRALLRRKGQVREVRTGEADSYGGEQSGINPRVSRSRKMGQQK